MGCGWSVAGCGGVLQGVGRVEWGEWVDWSGADNTELTATDLVCVCS